MHSTILLSTLLVPLLGLDPQTLRSQLDTLPWRPPVDRPTAEASSASEAPARESAPPSPPSTPVIQAASAPPVETTPAPRMDAKQGWQLQLAALANPDVARREQVRLEKSLGAGTVSIVLENGLSKLRWGSFPSREAADAARSELKTFRLEGFPVRLAP